MQDKHLSIIQSVSFGEGFKLIFLGRSQVGKIKGLRTVFWKGIVINLLIFVLLALVLNVVLHLWALKPLVIRFFGEGEGALAVTGSIVKWVVQLGLAALFAFVALHASIGMMGLWFEDLVSKVVAHFRPFDTERFEVKSWIGNIWDGLLIAVKDLIVLVLVFPLGFIPIVGGAMVFCGGAYVMGRSVLTPYLTVTKTPGTRVRYELKKVRLSAIKLGWPHAVLALIPVFGWIMMPIAITDQIIGLTYYIERARGEGASVSVDKDQRQNDNGQDRSSDSVCDEESSSRA